VSSAVFLLNLKQNTNVLGIAAILSRYLHDYTGSGQAAFVSRDLIDRKLVRRMVWCMQCMSPWWGEMITN